MSKKKSLSDEEILTSSFKGRRSFVKTLGAIGLGATAMVLGTKVATAGDPSPRNDPDGRNRYELPDKKQQANRD